jgi:hypothetical protein
VLQYLQEIQEDVKHFRALSQDKVVLLEEMLIWHVEIELVKELRGYLLEYKYKDADKLISEVTKLLTDPTE